MLVGHTDGADGQKQQCTTLGPAGGTWAESWEGEGDTDSSLHKSLSLALVQWKETETLLQFTRVYSTGF